VRCAGGGGRRCASSGATPGGRQRLGEGQQRGRWRGGRRWRQLWDAAAGAEERWRRRGGGLRQWTAVSSDLVGRRSRGSDPRRRGPAVAELRSSSGRGGRSTARVASTTRRSDAKDRRGGRRPRQTVRAIAAAQSEWRRPEEGMAMKVGAAMAAARRAPDDELVRTEARRPVGARSALCLRAAQRRQVPPRATNGRRRWPAL
jgi:hypothetical protein